MNPDETIDELRSELGTLRKEYQELARTVQTMEQNKFQMTRFLAPEQKQELRFLLDEQIADASWDDYLYISEFFQTTAAYSIGSSSSSPTVSGGAVQLITSATANGYQFLSKAVNSGGLFSSDREVRFKVNVRFGIDNIGAPDTEGVTNAKVYLLTLSSFSGSLDDLLGVSTGAATGFKVEDGILYGINMNAGKVSTVKLTEVSDLVFYSLNLKYFPRDRVDFYVNNVLYGSLNANMPTAVDLLSIGNFYIQTKNTDQKAMLVEYLEYMQRRIT